MPAIPASRLKPPILYALILVAAVLYGWAMFVSTFVAPGSIGPNFNGPGTDWMVFEAAAKSALSNNVAMIFDGKALTHFINVSFGHWLSESLPYRPFVYPPSVLVLVAPFGLMGFLLSYALFQCLSALLLVGAFALGSGRRIEGLVLAACAIFCPAGAVNVIDGQLAFLIAAFVVAGFRLLDARPWLAGCVLGLVSVKPQFAILLPFALVASGQWRALAGTILSAVVLAGASFALWGSSLWLTFTHQLFQSLGGGDPRWVNAGRLWGNSVYTCSILLGAPTRIASLLQLGAIVASIAVVILVFRAKRVDPDTRLAALLVLTVFAAPHWGAYDGVLIVIGGLLWIVRRPIQASWCWLLVATLWMIPLVSPPLIAWPGRIVPLLLAGFGGILLGEMAERSGRHHTMSPTTIPSGDQLSGTR